MPMSAVMNKILKYLLQINCLFWLLLQRASAVEWFAPNRTTQYVSATVHTIHANRLSNLLQCRVMFHIPNGFKCVYAMSYVWLDATTGPFQNF